jgi:hypothetical protein
MSGAVAEHPPSRSQAECKQGRIPLSGMLLLLECSLNCLSLLARYFVDNLYADEKSGLRSSLLLAFAQLFETTLLLKLSGSYSSGNT